MTQDNEALGRLLDRQAIADVIARYCRGVDRRDRPIMESAYWPDAGVDYVGYVGEVGRFFEFAWAATQSMITSHMICNMLVEFEKPGAAHVETYYVAYHDLPGANDGRVDMVIGGRYLDRLEKRGEEWRISQRVTTVDFNATMPGTAMWDQPFLASLKTRGGHFPDDPLYRRCGP